MEHRKLLNCDLNIRSPIGLNVAQAKKLAYPAARLVGQLKVNLGLCKRLLLGYNARCGRVSLSLCRLKANKLPSPRLFQNQDESSPCRCVSLISFLNKFHRAIIKPFSLLYPTSYVLLYIINVSIFQIFLTFCNIFPEKTLFFSFSDRIKK